MLLEAMYHVPRDKWAYAYNSSTIHLRVRTKRNDVHYVTALTGDKYDWNGTYKEIQLEKAASDNMFDYWEAAVKPQFKRLTYIFRITAGSEDVFLADNGIHYETPIQLEDIMSSRIYMKLMCLRCPSGPKKPSFIRS